MSSMNTSHFLLCLFQLGVRIIIHRHAFFKHIHSICLIGDIRPFCALVSRLVREQETIIATFIVAPHVLDKTRNEISRQFLDEPSESSNESGKCLRDAHRMLYTYDSEYSASNLKDLVIQLLEWRRIDGHGKFIFRCIPCSAY